MGGGGGGLCVSGAIIGDEGQGRTSHSLVSCVVCITTDPESRTGSAAENKARFISGRWLAIWAICGLPRVTVNCNQPRWLMRRDELSTQWSGTSAEEQRKGCKGCAEKAGMTAGEKVQSVLGLGPWGPGALAT